MKANIPFYFTKKHTIATPGNSYGLLESQFFRHVEEIDLRMERVITQADASFHTTQDPIVRRVRDSRRLKEKG